MAARRRGQGEGSVYFDDSRGVWVGAISLPEDGTGRRKRRKVTGKTEAAARRKMKQLQREYEHGPVPSDRLTLATVLREFLDHGLPPGAKSSQTVAGYRWAIEEHLIPGLGALKVRNLSPARVDGFLKDKQAQGFAKSSLSRIHGTLTRALRWAQVRGYVARNVSHIVTTPAGEKKESKSLTVDQAKALLRTARGDRFEALYLVMLQLGLRPGEVLGLRWQDIDFDNHTLSVRKAVVRHIERDPVTGKETVTLHLGGVKRDSRRTLGMPRGVEAALKKHKKTQASERLAVGPAWQERDLVFPSGTGSFTDPANLRRSVTRLARRAGIEGRWTPYELRHSAASILSAAGVRLEDVGDVLGHKDATVTAKVYRHLIEPTVTAGASAMEATFGGDDEALGG